MSLLVGRSPSSGKVILSRPSGYLIEEMTPDGARVLARQLNEEAATIEVFADTQVIHGDGIESTYSCVRCGDETCGGECCDPRS